MRRAWLLLVPLPAVLFGMWLRFCDSDVELNVLDMLVGVRPHHYEDKVVWVVGASSGIGEYFAKEVAKYGAKVVLSARRVDRLTQVASECTGKHAPTIVPLDMLSHETHQKAVDTVFTLHNAIDIVLLNAGRSQRSLAEHTEFEVTEAIVNLNFLSQVHLFKKILPLFFLQGGGQVGIVSSVSGRIGVPLLSSYSASKFALHGYFNSLRAETASRNVKVSIICPGPVVSEITKSAFGTDVSAPSSLSDHQELKMATERCAYLMAVGMSHQLKELWISTQPALFLLYLNQFLPAAFSQIWDKVIGPLRVKAFKSGGDVNDIKEIFSLK